MIFHQISLSFFTLKVNVTRKVLQNDATEDLLLFSEEPSDSDGSLLSALIPLSSVPLRWKILNNMKSEIKNAPSRGTRTRAEEPLLHLDFLGFILSVLCFMNMLGVAHLLFFYSL